MSELSAEIKKLIDTHVVQNDHARSDYFGLIKKLVAKRNNFTAGSDEFHICSEAVDSVYKLIGDELINNDNRPTSPVSFGTSGWRGIIGKDLFCKSVLQVTLAIINMYRGLEGSDDLCADLGVKDLAEAKQRGCVIGFDNRFGGELMAKRICDVLTANGFKVYYGGETTTGAISASVLQTGAAFSINLTPSHNPLEYGGFKFNAADAGPAASTVTNMITKNARGIIENNDMPDAAGDPALLENIDSLALWISQVRHNVARHGLDYDAILAEFKKRNDLVLAVDCVHGASRNHIQSLLQNPGPDKLILFRTEADYTFGGIAPEPSTANMRNVVAALTSRPEPLKLGMILDPDGDRIRFNDGAAEIGMNQFGAMAYHFLHEHKHKKGMVAKTVATSNFANAIAAGLGEEVFETRVGFKEFKPVINKALVYFEESDGISVIGHTPEKDAYIGLLIAMDMALSLKLNLSDYLAEIESKFGSYFPDRDGIVVSKHGAELKKILSTLDKYQPGGTVTVGQQDKTIKKVIAIDGHKMIFDDDSWLMIRPSGTEPKVRFYVEARSADEKAVLVQTAKKMLQELQLL